MTNSSTGVMRSGHAASIAAACRAMKESRGTWLGLGLGLGLALGLGPGPGLGLGLGSGGRVRRVASHQLVQLYAHGHMRGCENRPNGERCVRDEHRRTRAHAMRDRMARGGGGGGGGGAGARERVAMQPERPRGSGGGWRSRVQGRRGGGGGAEL